ncbi:hypothetical protein D3C78_1792870 [compost metagenome]
MLQVRNQAVGNINRRTGQIAQCLPLQYPWLRPQMTANQVIACLGVRYLQTLLQHGQPGGAVTQRTGGVDPVADTRTAAGQCPPGRDQAVNG